MTQRQRDKEIVQKMTEIRKLLAGFGVTLHGFDPGVTGFFKGGPISSQVAMGAGFPAGWAGEPFSMNRQQWTWLKPLLEELRAYRAKQKKP